MSWSLSSPKDLELMQKDLALALYQPDIPQNTGTLLRLGACLDLPVHIIEPTGFILSDQGLKRAGMDYLTIAAMERHLSWQHFQDWRAEQKRRLILLTTKTDDSYTDFEFQSGDILMLGRESSGVPDDVHEAVDARVTIKMHKEARSLNIACAASMVVGEAIRQVR